MNTVTLHTDDVKAIQDFIDRQEGATSEYITITVDSSSGIGSIITVSMPAVVNGDLVTITKTIVDESSW